LTNSNTSGGGRFRLSIVSVDTALCDGPSIAAQSRVTAPFGKGYGARGFVHARHPALAPHEQLPTAESLFHAANFTTFNGMPMSVREVEQAIDEAAGTNDWLLPGR
jgi:hypothetical protein